MKKLFSGLLVFLLAVTMFADSKDVVDGVIEVADEGKFPAGHFGQAAGYLPGDSIFVSNPATGVTLQFLNLGTLDSAEGVAVLLSKESAKTLGLDQDKNVRCKLNMRYGSFDESVVGQAVIDENDAVKLAKADVKVPAEEKTAEPMAVEEIPAEVVEAVEDAPVAGVPLIEEEIAEEVAEEASAETEESVAVAVESEEEIVEEYEVDDEDFAGTKKAVEAPSPAEIAEVEEAVAAEVVEEAVAEEIVVEEVPAEEKTVPVVEESVLADTRSVEEEVVAEEVVAEEVVAEDEEYAPIVLVPTEKVVPETAETVVVESAMSSREETVVPVEEKPVETKVEVAETRTASPKTSFEKYVVESENLLPKNSWYVQIASYGNVENIEKTVNKYSKYPLNLVPNGKGAYRVIIGPLNEDEYASVLKKFKAFGFKDAFLRKK